jgi:hypothetical protein
MDGFARNGASAATIATGYVDVDIADSLPPRPAGVRPP